MKRLLAVAAVSAAVLGLAGPAGAVDEHAPHGGSGSHPHHVHTGDGSCRDLSGPEFERGARGRHRAGVESGEVHHESCATAHPTP